MTEPIYETLYDLDVPSGTRKCALIRNGETAEGPHVIRVLAQSPSVGEDRIEATFDGIQFSPV